MLWNQHTVHFACFTFSTPYACFMSCAFLHVFLWHVHVLCHRKGADAKPQNQQTVQVRACRREEADEEP